MRRAGDLARPARVLLIEDNPADVRLLREALAELSVEIELEVVGDGEEAMRFLTDKAVEGEGFPDLILLDLNLPRKDGREVLVEIKSDPALRRIPVIVLSTSSAEHDVRAAYDMHANAYLKKPSRFSELRELVAEIERFWLGSALLPA